MNVANVVPGFRIQIAESDYSGSQCARYTGVGNVANAVHCACPNCGNPVFPALNFEFPDALLSAVIRWTSPALRVVVCPFCALYMAPYWIRHIGDAIEIVGGYRDGGEVLLNIETPYLCRELLLTPLAAEDYPLDEERLDKLEARRRAPGVYHQIGGLPIKNQTGGLDCCDCGRAMRFTGILDYDDLNVPLYEDDHSPVALIIGDGDSLNIYSCKACSVIGLKWNK